MCTRFYTISTLFCQREECCEKLTHHCSFRSTESSDEKLSPEDIAKIQRNRVAAMVRRFAHYLKEPQWKERLQPGTHPSPLSLSLSRTIGLVKKCQLLIVFALCLNNVESFLRITSSR